VPLCSLPQKHHAGVAQLVEQLTRNEQVVGSNPTSGFSSLSASWPKRLGSQPSNPSSNLGRDAFGPVDQLVRSPASQAGGCEFNPRLGHFSSCSSYAPVAQWIERSPPEREVAGSNPAGGTLEGAAEWSATGFEPLGSFTVRGSSPPPSATAPRRGCARSAPPRLQPQSASPRCRSMTCGQPRYPSPASKP
jgi:hypothetical protein